MGLFGKKERVTDPVCGMVIDPKAAVGTETHDDRTFHFCSATCMAAFRNDPHRYGH